MPFAPQPERADHGPLRSVVVATDFSENAEDAFHWALHIARRHRAHLVIVHAVESISGNGVPLDLQEEVTRGLGRLEGAARQADVDVRSIYRVGRAWDVIIDIERAIAADLVVVGMRGHTVYSRIFLGSTADRVVRAAQAPVLTVRPGAATEVPEIRTVLVATDFSQEASLAIDAVMRLIGPTPGAQRIVLLHACHVPLEYGIDGAVGAVVGAIADTEARASRQLEELAASLRSNRLQVETRTKVGYPATEIEREAKAVNADLVAVGTRGRSGLQHLLVGSVAERILRHAPCPVMTVRHPEPTEPAPAENAPAAAVKL